MDLDISVMTVSIPIDIETLEEMEALIEEAAHVDLTDYNHLLNTAGIQRRIRSISWIINCGR